MLRLALAAVVIGLVLSNLFRAYDKWGRVRRYRRGQRKRAAVRVLCIAWVLVVAATALLPLLFW
jgi:uncharacterized membrane protein YidH (DUF202 family)